MTNDLRLFIAIELPASLRAAIEDVQDDLRQEMPDRAVRWTRPESIHLTLKFLGDTPANQKDIVTRSISPITADYTPLLLEINGAGCFPKTGRPRIVWLGLDGDMDPLRALQASVEDALALLGFPREDRPFSPHLTIGRMQRNTSSGDARAVRQAIETTMIGRVGAWTAGAVSLMYSELRPDGARYTCLHEAALGRPLT